MLVEFGPLLGTACNELKRTAYLVVFKDHIEQRFVYQLTANLSLQTEKNNSHNVFMEVGLSYPPIKWISEKY